MEKLFLYNDKIIMLGNFQYSIGVIFIFDLKESLIDFNYLNNSPVTYVDMKYDIYNSNFLVSLGNG